MLYLVFLFIILNISCSVPEEGIRDMSIDLSLVNNNDWKMSKDILTYINLHRLELNKKPLILDSLYATAYAIQHSKYMIETRTVNHNNFYKRSEGLKKRGAVKVAENVAYAYSSAQSVVNAWIKSVEHRGVIESNFTHIGFGVLKCIEENRYYYTTLYYK
ncbi:CAP domain-containing protein [Algibacter agarivorans]|uniref:CAP domain-containing protein n=1 Tax=Algibacter agarivorans TaxID=1109741 RepID=UPI0031E98B73